MQLLRDRRLALLVAGQALNGMGSWCAIVGGLFALWRVRADEPYRRPVSA